jgi:hypothetical protein
VSQLSPAHPISKYAPPEFREKIDVLGQHLIWRGVLSKPKRGSHARPHPMYSRSHPNKQSWSVDRLVWSYVLGEDLPEELVLYHKPSCPYDRCVAPGCYEKMTKEACGALCNQLAKDSRAVS